MVLLSNKQIDAIHDLLVAHGVAYDTLRMDLLDHLCCMVEERMDRGASFDAALADAVREFGPSGLEKAQEETLDLLNTTLRKMKKVTSIIGITGSFLALTGVVFKIMYWQGANLSLALGILTIALIYLPMLLWVRLKEVSGSVLIFTNATGILAAMVFLISVLFRVMHWPYSNALMTGSLLWIAFVFIPGYFIRSYRMAENKLMSVAYVLVLFTGVFLLYRMTTLGNSKEMRNGIYVMHQSLRMEVHQANEERARLLAHHRQTLPEEMIAFQTATDTLINYIEGMRVKSIALTQEVSLPKAATMNLQYISWGRAAGFLQDNLLDQSSSYNATELRQYIEDWKQAALATGIAPHHLEHWLKLEELTTPEYGKLSWEEAHFRHATVVSLITYLDQLSLEVNHRFIQALSMLIEGKEAGRANELSMEFNSQRLGA